MTNPAPPTGVRVDYHKVISNLAVLAKIDESSGEGINRPSYSKSYRAAIDWLSQTMQSAGMRTREDTVGNLIGRIGPDGPALLCGSHIDTVPRGGAYDGALGVLAGIECARALIVEEDRLQTAFEVIVFADEEGAYLSLLGSRAMTGGLSPDSIALAKGRDGDLLSEALRRYGLDPAQLNEAARTHDEFAGYIELHIEQGPILASEGVDIGIVDAIFGIQTFEFLLRGHARHAGTTPIRSRQDALRAAAEAISEAFSRIPAEDLDKVRLTYGDVKVSPGASNVVPENATVIQEVRAADTGTIERISKLAQVCFAACAARNAVQIKTRLTSADAPAALSAIIAAQIEDACRVSALSFRHMTSGAGHDAQAFADICETGMIFVPSLDGISHHPDEQTAQSDIKNGLTALYLTCRSRLIK